MSRLGTFLLGFGAASVTALAVTWAQAPETGWVCADFGNEVLADAVREGRSFVWVDDQGRPHKVAGTGTKEEDWYCVQSELNARQLARPIGSDAEAYR